MSYITSSIAAGEESEFSGFRPPNPYAAAKRQQLVQTAWVTRRALSLQEEINSDRRSKLSLQLKLEELNKCFPRLSQSFDRVTAIAPEEEVVRIIEEQSSILQDAEEIQASAIQLLDQLAREEIQEVTAAESASQVGSDRGAEALEDTNAGHILQTRQPLQPPGIPPTQRTGQGTTNVPHISYPSSGDNSGRGSGPTPPLGQVTNTVGNIGDGANTGHVPSGMNHIKFAKLEYPTCDGTHESWYPFNSFLKGHVIPNREITPHQKLTILKALCKGPAQELMKSIDPDEDSFEFAYELLCDRYGDSDLMRIHLMKDINELEAPKASGPTRVGSMWTFHDKILNLRRKLTRTGMSPEEASQAIYPRVVHKLPEDIGKLWATHPDTKAQLGNLEYLMNFFKGQIRGLEVYEAFAEPVSTTKSKKTTEHLQGTATALTVASRNSGQGATCIICKKGHWFRKCPKYLLTDIDKRYQLVEVHGVCKRCLNTNHTTDQCRWTCHQCGSDEHHGTLCRVKSQQQQSTVATVPVATVPVAAATGAASGGATNGYQRVQVAPPTPALLQQDAGKHQLNPIAKPWKSGWSGC